MPIVDVRDVAEMHLRAITTLKAAGQRFIAADSSMWFHEMAATLKAHLPGRRIVTMQAPNFAVRILALFDPAIAGILPNLGQQPQVSNAKARDILGMRFIDASKSMTETADYLIAEGLVT
jgi:dihydroflavonol-4-reductase